MINDGIGHNLGKIAEQLRVQNQIRLLELERKIITTDFASTTAEEMLKLMQAIREKLE